MPLLHLWNLTSPERLKRYERALLDTMGVAYSVYHVPLNNTAFPLLLGEFINTLEIVGQRQYNSPVVVIHGFASAMATFVNVLSRLSHNCSYVYAIDLLGFGASSKPHFPCDPQSVEDLFVDSIECWRIRMGLNEMILCAHSFGAYVATCYAHKYPAATKALILFEPWGFQTKPTQSLPLVLNPLRLLKMSGPASFQLMRLAVGDLFSTTFAGIGSGDDMLHYLYHCNVQCTGDAGFMALISSSYLARRPLVSAHGSYFICGEDSWIECVDGAEVISGAGHQVYADRLEEFVGVVFRIIGLVCG